MVKMEEFPMSSTNFISGYKVVENKGFVYGLTVRARGIGGDIGAGIKGILGGEIKQYVAMMEDSREESIQRCIEHAKEMGANAIISVRMDSDSISQNMQEVLTYGTAVVIEKE
ncbi:heavy metal-binding domain-containing protein [Methanobrevibacter sp.]|uniref:heavy metal-binding domain-containing protein n=1 Tax=Methanobrevibacter sp. TaxID=66852 RepID=UPI00388E2CA2